MRTNKFLYGWKLQVDYGQGWEYECFELTFREEAAQAKCYRENCPYPVRIIAGRELNTENTTDEP